MSKAYDSVARGWLRSSMVAMGFRESGAARWCRFFFFQSVTHHGCRTQTDGTKPRGQRKREREERRNGERVVGEKEGGETEGRRDGRRRKGGTEDGKRGGRKGRKVGEEDEREEEEGGRRRERKRRETERRQEREEGGRKGRGRGGKGERRNEGEEAANENPPPVVTLAQTPLLRARGPANHPLPVRGTNLLQVPPPRADWWTRARSSLHQPAPGGR
jgi:hypothetical protein